MMPGLFSVMEHSLLGDEAQVEDELVEMLESIKAGEEIDTSRFWSIVGQVKRDPDLKADLANLVGAVDTELFKRSSLVKLPMVLGNVLELGLLVAGALLVYLAIYPFVLPLPTGVSLPFLSGVLFLVGQVALATAVHPLAHQLVGRMNDISFSFYFLNGPAKVEPSVKTNYATYLRAPPSARAKMHLSGAVATNLLALTVLAAGVAFGAPGWSLLLMAFVFVGGALNEFAPALLVRLGNPSPLGIDMKKTDTYRYLREKGYS